MRVRIDLESARARPASRPSSSCARPLARSHWGWGWGGFQQPLQAVTVWLQHQPPGLVSPQPPRLAPASGWVQAPRRRRRRVVTDRSERGRLGQLEDDRKAGYGGQEGALSVRCGGWEGAAAVSA
eukprot:COSAG02_NODE_8125_length_2697_cov_181.379113_2_plen_125_part_00